MWHAWVFEVLSDLRIYALSNGLQKLATKTAEAEAAAREDIAGLAEGPQENGEEG